MITGCIEYVNNGMTDILSPEERSRLMASVRSKDTKPEMRVRKLVHGLGFRYRLHGKPLPGSPDLVLPKYKSVIFVHGCYWHRHPGCKEASMPKTNAEFWQRKFEENITRDRRNLDDLNQLGWRSLVVWECETENLGSLSGRITDFLRAS